jgi:hypothetical protein
MAAAKGSFASAVKKRSRLLVSAMMTFLFLDVSMARLMVGREMV